MGMRAGAYFKVVIRRAYAQITEEAIIHRFIVMLAGMDKFCGYAGCLKRRHDGRDFHEVRPGADYA